ncbi:SRPBCC family protein [Hyalangium minutum]|uniref:Polyketide cyclase n=1 Tax=Hyalangium minutum TaxID=394096 RepID=A0A085WFB6_9BACT|nr:SRPBCC family protein [Hyalangium minutum]KFE66379.1 hypothetical protein DB31_0852 [Hyalangium minutum]
MLKKILISLGVVIVGFVGFVSTRPDTFTVQRTAKIQASPEFAFALVNDFHHWNEWSPWDAMDANMKRTFEGAAGIGAKYGWVGNDQVGEGRMTIEESKPNELVRIKLEFLKPMETASTTTFEFKPEEAGSLVTWRMEGNHNFISKAMCVFMDMDTMVGGDFEKGLASMKKVAEAEATKRNEERMAAEKAAAEKAAAAAASANPAPAAGATAATPTP